MAKSRKWMSKAFTNSHGQFRAKVQRAGMSMAAFVKRELAPGWFSGGEGQTDRLAKASVAAAGNAQRPRDVLQRHDLRRRTEQPWWNSVTRDTADDGTDSRIDRLCDDVGEVGDPATHGLDFRIGQLVHFTHDLPPSELHVKNIWLKESQRLTRV